MNSEIKELKNDLSKTNGKSKIFKFLKDQEEEIAPKFTYTQVDTLREHEKRKKLGIEE
jgi:hypothetical protein